jgi:hypothetical protein
MDNPFFGKQIKSVKKALLFVENPAYWRLSRDEHTLWYMALKFGAKASPKSRCLDVFNIFRIG